MSKLPMEVIDRLFACLATFYGERFTGQYSAKNEAYNKTIWQSALYGCNEDEIRATLKQLKREAENEHAKPPHQMEFYKYIREGIPLVINYGEQNRPAGSKEVAMNALNEIRGKLGRNVLHGTV